jgi:leader peptidase (prepilin peptidase)/N-methyltransferase
MDILQRFVTQEPLTGLPNYFIVAAVASLGAIIGSFLNVVIHRVPREESIAFPASHCPSCDTAIRPYDNIPIISWAVLRGRCRSCRAPISARYPAVELLTCALFALTYLLHSGLTLSLPFDLAFVAAIVALVFIDAEHMLLPNVITYPGAALALVARLIVPNLYGVASLGGEHTPAWLLSLGGALLGALAGGGFLWLVGWLWERARGVEAMGLGDVKMMLMVGAFLGWPLTLLAIFVGVLTGSLAGVAAMLRRGERDMQMLLPFGIFLGLGSLVSLLFGTRIIDWYVGKF